MELTLDIFIAQYLLQASSGRFPNTFGTFLLGIDSKAKAVPMEVSTVIAELLMAETSEGESGSSGFNDDKIPPPRPGLRVWVAWWVLVYIL